MNFVDLNRPGDSVLVTGGAGFIGTNLTSRLADAGRRVRILDNLSRPGVEENLAWLRSRYPAQLDVVVADLEDAEVVERTATGVDAVIHLGAQVAVTSSLEEPVADFRANLEGTLNILEALRGQLPKPIPLLFTSTNKVYGSLPDLRLQVREGRYWPVDPDIASNGISETQPLSFATPYGCSKGAADQYVLEYASAYGVPAVVFRMSCIYGPHQKGTEDQGWVAHFFRQALAGERIVIYGDGRQVRDVLHVTDLVEAVISAFRHLDRTRGRAFNIGGGPARAVSVQQVISAIGRLCGDMPPMDHGPWRSGDQRYYVSDVREFIKCGAWRPRVPVSSGLRDLHQHLAASRVQGHSSASAKLR